jgi:hypothetical protein
MHIWVPYRKGHIWVQFGKGDRLFGLFQQASLPYETKLVQTKKFNNPDHPCKVLIATDSINIKLYLNIGRVIFNSVIKPTINKKGKKEMVKMINRNGLFFNTTLVLHLNSFI